MDAILFPLFMTPHQSLIHPAVAVAFIENKKHEGKFVKPVVEYYLFKTEDFVVIKLKEFGESLQRRPLFGKVCNADIVEPEEVVETIRNQIGTGVRLFIYPCMTEIIEQMCIAGEWKPVIMTEHLGYEDVPTDHLSDDVIKSISSRLQSLIQYL
jgi:hypothetical protein